jgi:hypothetical protein
MIGLEDVLEVAAGKVEYKESNFNWPMDTSNCETCFCKEVESDGRRDNRTKNKEDKQKYSINYISSFVSLPVIEPLLFNSRISIATDH